MLLGVVGEAAEMSSLERSVVSTLIEVLASDMFFSLPSGPNVKI